MGYGRLKGLLRGHKYVNTEDDKYRIDEVVTEELERRYAYEIGTNDTIEWTLRRIEELESMQSACDVKKYR